MIGPSRKRSCAASNAAGSPCGFTPMGGEPFCFWHHPDYEAEAAEARRLGGRRRRREKAIEGAYDLPESLDSVEAVRRFVNIAALDLLGAESSVARSNSMLRTAGVALKLIETGDMERRIADLEAALKNRSPDPPSPFDLDLPEIEGPSEPEPSQN